MSKKKKADLHVCMISIRPLPNTLPVITFELGYKILFLARVIRVFQRDLLRLTLMLCLVKKRDEDIFTAISSISDAGTKNRHVCYAVSLYVLENKNTDYTSLIDFHFVSVRSSIHHLQNMELVWSIMRRVHGTYVPFLVCFFSVKNGALSSYKSPKNCFTLVTLYHDRQIYWVQNSSLFRLHNI